MLSILLVILISIIRYATGPEFALSLFYIFPITLAAWHIGRWAGNLLSVMSAILWLVADLRFSNRFSSIAVPFINESFRLIVFLIIANMVFELKRSLDNQKKLARTDSLTDISNRRAFFEFAGMEINKARRYNRPISMLYLDIDNFKSVNDNWGHDAGDLILCEVAQLIKEHMRVIDIVARFGGDEFGILMSRTEARAAYSVAVKLKERLMSLAEKSLWPVTFSMGLVTYETVPESVDDILKTADALLLRAKVNGKDRIEHEIISAPDKMKAS